MQKLSGDFKIVKAIQQLVAPTVKQGFGSWICQFVSQHLDQHLQLSPENIEHTEEMWCLDEVDDESIGEIVNRKLNRCAYTNVCVFP